MNAQNKQLYLEGYAGISGDMTVAALLDLGADPQVLKAALASLPLEGYRIAISRVNKGGLDACDFDVILDHDNHDHDMAYLYGDAHGRAEHPHADHHHHDHADAEHHHGAASGHHHHAHGHHHHDHGHHHHGHHEHRGLPEITRIIEAGALTAGARALALRIFDILAEAEAKAHNKPKDQVHFHEVGAVDAIVDIVAAAVCLDNLGIRDAVVSPLFEGRGSVRCAHGVLPVPVPAVVNIAAAHELPLHQTDRFGEWVTPTGAAIAAAVRTRKALPACYTVVKTGIGAGKRDTGDIANVLRAMIIQSDAPVAEEDTILKLETNIDDATGECLGRVLDRLMAAGARDVHYLPVYMKKNRPGYELVVITDAARREALERIIFEETTSIGIRRCEMARSILPREDGTVDTPLGPVRVKRCRIGDRLRVYPEYADVAAICAERQLLYPDVYAQILAACQPPA